MTEGKTRYGFSNAINGYFEFPTENARRILPPQIEPVELHHGSSVFAMTVFDFTESEVGPYAEVVMAVVVAPLLTAGERLPKAAMYPYRVATTTRAAREHAIERWHLPHWMEDVAVEWRREGPRVTARVSAEGEPVAELSITERSWEPISQMFQAFMNDDSGGYVANMQFDGEQSEHENEEGRLALAEHPFNCELVIPDIYDVPFRELWMRNGVQTFDPLRTLPRA